MQIDMKVYVINSTASNNNNNNNNTTGTTNLENISGPDSILVPNHDAVHQTHCNNVSRTSLRQLFQRVPVQQQEGATISLD